jgi:hypothetical protein
MRSAVITAESINITVSWDMTPCNLQPPQFLQTKVPIYQTALCRRPCGPENIKSPLLDKDLRLFQTFRWPQASKLDQYFDHSVRCLQSVCCWLHAPYSTWGTNRIVMWFYGPFSFSPFPPLVIAVSPSINHATCGSASLSLPTKPMLSVDVACSKWHVTDSRVCVCVLLSCNGLNPWQISSRQLACLLVTQAVRPVKDFWLVDLSSHSPSILSPLFHSYGWITRSSSVGESASR